MSNTVLKEFSYLPTKTRVRLVAGFEDERPVYHAVEVRKGEPFDADYKIDSQIFGASVEQYGRAAAEFARAVRPML